MAHTRIIGLILCGLWLSLGAPGQAAADGLAKFDKTLKSQIPPGVLTYKSAKGLGDNGFVLEEVVITPPPDPGKKAEPITIKTVTVEDLDFDSIEKQAPPLFAKIRIEGIAAGNNPAAGVDLKQMAGIDKLSADFQLDYKLDGGKKTFTLNRMELNLNGLGRLEVTAALDGVGVDAVANPGAAMDSASLRTASLVYDDHSLLGKLLPVIAAMQSSDPAAFVEMAKDFLDSAREGQGPEAQKAIDSLVAFLEDYEKPKGPLRVTVNPSGKVSSAELNNAKTPDDIVKLLGLQVNYAGTRTSKPGEPAAEEKEKK